jgi:hypothetical protein
MNDWINLQEAVLLTGKSINTIRKLTTECKNNKNRVKQIKGKYYINTSFLIGIYPATKEYQKSTSKTTNEETKHKKEAMQIAYNSEIIKAKDEHIKQKDKQLEILINKKSYIGLYLVTGFVVLILILGTLAYMYRSELLGNHKKEVETLNENVNSLNNQLNNTKNTYTILIDNLQKTHTKLNTIQEGRITQQETEINRLLFELKSINKQTKTDTE